MSSVFLLDAEGNATRVSSSPAQNEAKDLHRLLEKNPQLLRGDQIGDGNELRWILIRSEMPVPGPASGSNQWSLDLFFADQHGVPTLVECKKYLNTQSRREIVGQMLEYVANGRHYWSKDDLRVAAETTHGENLPAKLLELGSDVGSDPDAYFTSVAEKFRQGKVRMIFFLDQAPNELRSIVEFLNGQMQDAEVLIVEAKQFMMPGNTRIMVPSLFGFTEKARVAKRADSTLPKPGRKWDEESFFEEAERSHGIAVSSALRTLYEFLKESGTEIRWGAGAVDGSFSIGLPQLSFTGPGRSFLSAYSSGVISFNFNYMIAKPAMQGFREGLHAALRQLNFRIPEAMAAKYPTVSPKDWMPRVGALIEVLRHLFAVHFPSSAESGLGALRQALPPGVENSGQPSSSLAQEQAPIT